MAARGAGHGAFRRGPRGVINLTRTLALEWAQHGIRVNAVSPALPTLRPCEKYNISYDVREIVPLGRFGTVEEVVEAIMFMGTAAYITGEVLTVDGGYWLK